MKAKSLLLAGILILGFSFVGPCAHSATDQELEQAYAAEKSWPHVRYATVKAYLYNLDYQDLTLRPDILDKGQLTKSVVNRKGILLSPAQIQTLLSSSCLAPPHQNGLLVFPHSNCGFDPHVAFVFYGSNHYPVATMEVCTICYQIDFWPARKNEYASDFKAIEALFKELGLPVFRSSGDIDIYLQKH